MIEFICAIYLIIGLCFSGWAIGRIRYVKLMEDSKAGIAIAIIGIGLFWPIFLGFYLS